MASQMCLPARESIGLFNGGSELICVGLAAGRAVSAARRSQLGLPPGAGDAEALTLLSQTVRTTADDVLFFESLGARGSVPSQAQEPARHVEEVIIASAQSVWPAGDGEISDGLVALADGLRAAAAGCWDDQRDTLHGFCVRISEMVLHKTAAR